VALVSTRSASARIDSCANRFFPAHPAFCERAESDSLICVRARVAEPHGAHTVETKEQLDLSDLFLTNAANQTLDGRLPTIGIWL
jgi:hypothetical protein